MSANFNIALLRNLESSLTQALADLEASLPKAVPGQAGELVTLAHQVTGSLQMVRCNAVSRVAQTLEDAVTGVNEAPRRGWGEARVVAVCKSALALCTAIRLHLQRMLQETGVMPLALWPAWKATVEDIGLPSPDPLALFEPDPQFDPGSFQALEKDYLRGVVEAAADRLRANIQAWQAVQEPPQADAAARAALEIFDWVYGLRHREQFQVYWLILRARLALGLLAGAASLYANRHAWIEMLESAEVELRKFGSDYRLVATDQVLRAIGPILKDRWPPQVGMAHPVLAELDKCLGLTTFWASLDELTAPANAGSGENALAHQVQALKSMRAFVAACAKVFAGGGAGEIKTMLQQGMAVLSTEEWFTDPRLRPLFDLVRSMVAASTGKSQSPWSPSTVAEMACALLLFEEVIERLPMSDPVAERVQAQMQRLATAGTAQSPSVPVVRWDDAWRRHRATMAERRLVAAMLRRVAQIQASWGERVSGDATPASLDGSIQDLKTFSGILAFFDRPAAAALSMALAETCDAWRNNPDVQQTQIIASALSDYRIYLESWDIATLADLDRLGSGAAAIVGEEPLAMLVAAERSLRRPPSVSIQQESIQQEFIQQESVKIIAAKTVQSQAAPASEPAVPVSPPEQSEQESLHARLLTTGVSERYTTREIAASFVDESLENLERWPATAAALMASPHDQESWADLRRIYHTVKGSGRIAGYEGIGEVASWVETAVEQWMEEEVAYSTALDKCLERIRKQFIDWFMHLRANRFKVKVNGEVVYAALEDANAEARRPPVSVEPAPAQPAPPAHAVPPNEPVKKNQKQEAWAQMFAAVEALAETVEKLAAAVAVLKNAETAEAEPD